MGSSQISFLEWYTLGAGGVFLFVGCLVSGFLYSPWSVMEHTGVSIASRRQWRASHNYVETQMTEDNFVRQLLIYIGEDPDREGLKETPQRVLKAWKELTSGYNVDVSKLLKCFEDAAKNYNELVIVHNIPIVSTCEHHLASIVGIAHIGYIPKGRLVGLSKLARLADVYARRLTVQEVMTSQIADALVKYLEPVGVGVLVRANHACMSTRGVKIHGSTTTTSAMRGVLLLEASARKEFMDLCAMAERDR